MNKGLRICIRKFINLIVKTGFMLVLLLLAVMPKRAEAESSDYEIKDGILIRYHGKEGVITIPETVTSIGKEAFRGIDFLFVVTIPDSVTTIGEGAFRECSNLKTVSIPDSVTTIEKDAFFWCKKLSEVSIPNSVTYIGDSAFAECYAITGIDIPDSVTYIDDGAFCGCSSLVDVTIPKTAYIGGNVFGYTPWIEKKRKENPLVIINNILIDARFAEGKVTIPKSVRIIAGDAFTFNKKASSITIPDGVTYIGRDAFSFCEKLSRVDIPASVTYIGNGAFSFSEKISRIEIPSSVDYIGRGAFYGCTSLSEIIIPSTVSFIGDLAFADTPWLAKKQKENPLVIVNNMLVDGRAAKGDVTIPKSVNIIVGRAFYENNEIKSITIPDSVANIGDYAFTRCSKLTDVIFKNSDIIFGEDVFYKRNDKLTFYCASDSSAREYAKDYGIKVKALDLELNKTSVTVKKGKTYQLKVTFYVKDKNTQKVTWTSSDKKVATVSSGGLIKGVKPGNATITAKLPNGEKVSCKVVVK